ncbi:uncharacterized protein [Dermacentor albipictus]|uniref:uncharacterized protein n=1 Tax=Dermacentor albipictus TaxID=60249 RepID=UPI0038FD2DF3
MKLDEEESMQVDMGSAGTPQGSVVSPMLFNLVMIGLSEILERIEGTNHNVYVDDITIWTTKDASEGGMEDRLQELMEAIENHLEGTGLECSPEKSELLLYRPRRLGKPSRDVAELHKTGIRLTKRKGTEIPMVQKVRVLRLWIEARGRNAETITRLEKKVTATVRLNQKVSSDRSGIEETNVVRLVQALAISHVAYVAAFVHWNKAEKDKIDALIRKAYRTALGLPQYTRNERLLQLGVHNTLGEIAEAQRIAQLERLSRTKAGREIMEKIGINYHGMNGPKTQIHPDV